MPRHIGRSQRGFRFSAAASARGKGRLAALILAAAAAAAAGPATAQTPTSSQPPQASSLAPADAALVGRAEDYLQSLKAAEGRFTQVDGKGRLTAGTFAFERPGRARFAYDGAKGLLVVSDGDAVSVYDRRMKSFDQYPLEQTPLVLLLGDKVRLESALTVTKVTRTFGGFVFEARDARGRAPGRLALAFSLSPLALTGWSIIDAQNQKTSVHLTRLERRARLPANLFVLKDPAAEAAP